MKNEDILKNVIMGEVKETYDIYVNGEFTYISHCDGVYQMTEYGEQYFKPIENVPCKIRKNIYGYYDIFIEDVSKDIKDLIFKYILACAGYISIELNTKIFGD